MIAALLATPLFSLAQAVADVPPAPPRTVAEDRLTLCLDAARTDPATAIGEASEWAEGLGGPDASYPQQCLGFAYTALLRWEAAEAAFLAARDAALPAGTLRRAQLGAMAANAALAEGRAAAALAILGVAARDALAAARTLDAQSALAWLLSATLARREGDLKRAGTDITEALRRSGDDPMVQFEAGNIAAAAGDEANARTHWGRVVELSPGSPLAESARKALEQFGVAEK